MHLMDTPRGNLSFAEHKSEAETGLGCSDHRETAYHVKCLCMGLQAGIPTSCRAADRWNVFVHGRSPTARRASGGSFVRAPKRRRGPCRFCRRLASPTARRAKGDPGGFQTFAPPFFPPQAVFRPNSRISHL